MEWIGVYFLLSGLHFKVSCRRSPFCVPHFTAFYSQLARLPPVMHDLRAQRCAQLAVYPKTINPLVCQFLTDDYLHPHGAGGFRQLPSLTMAGPATIDWDAGPPNPPTKQGMLTRLFCLFHLRRGSDSDQWPCADQECDRSDYTFVNIDVASIIEPIRFPCRQKYVLKAEYDELSAKCEQLQLRIRELTGDAPQSHLTDRTLSDLIQRRPPEGSPSVSLPGFRIGAASDVNMPNVSSACSQ